MGFENRPAVVGMALRPEALYAVAVLWHAGVPKVHASVRLPLPAGNNPHDPNLDGAGSAISAAVRRLRHRPRRVHFAMPFPMAQCRAMELPFVHNAQRGAVLRAELDIQKLLPAGEGGAAALWREGTPPQAHPLGGTAFFLRESVLAAWEESAGAAGRRFDGVEPESIAAARAVFANHAGRPTAVLVTTDDSWELLVSDGQRITLHRQIPGGRRESIRHPESSSTEPAPVPNGLAPMGASPSSGAETAPPFLAAELARSLAFHRRSHPDIREIECLWTTGMELPHALATAIATALGHPLVPCFPLDVPDPVDDSERMGWASAVGAALAEESPLPPPTRVARAPHESAARRRAPQIVGAGMIGSALVLLGSGVLSWTLDRDEAAWTSQRTKWMQRLAQERRRDAPRWRAQDIALAVDSSTAGKQIPIAQWLEKLAARDLEGVSLDRVTVDSPTRWEWEGESISPEALGRFLQTGDGAPRVAARLQSLRLDPVGRIRFTAGPSSEETPSP